MYDWIRKAVLFGRTWYAAADVATALGYNTPLKAVFAYCSRPIVRIELDGMYVYVIDKQDVLKLYEHNIEKKDFLDWLNN